MNFNFNGMPVTSNNGGSCYQASAVPAQPWRPTGVLATRPPGSRPAGCLAHTVPSDWLPGHGLPKAMDVGEFALRFFAQLKAGGRGDRVRQGLGLTSRGREGPGGFCTTVGQHSTPRKPAVVAVTLHNY